MPPVRFPSLRAAVRRPEYRVRLELPSGARVYRIEAIDLDHLADVIEAELRADRPNTHVGVRLDPNGTVLVRYGWTASSPLGTWAPAAAGEVAR